MKDATAYSDSRYLTSLLFIEASVNDNDNRQEFTKKNTMHECKTSPRLKYMADRRKHYTNNYNQCQHNTLAESPETMLDFIDNKQD
jgi:hypothetical protein